MALSSPAGGRIASRGSLMTDVKIITWDGERIPDEFRDLPPGRYAIASIDEPPALTDAEDAGIRAALDTLDAGRGVPLTDVMRQIRRGDRAK
jgi:hypothetical protein